MQPIVACLVSELPAAAVTAEEAKGSQTADNEDDHGRFGDAGLADGHGTADGLGVDREAVGVAERVDVKSEVGDTRALGVEEQAGDAEVPELAGLEGCRVIEGNFHQPDLAGSTGVVKEEGTVRRQIELVAVDRIAAGEIGEDEKAGVVVEDDVVGAERLRNRITEVGKPDSNDKRRAGSNDWGGCSH